MSSECWSHDPQPIENQGTTDHGYVSFHGVSQCSLSTDRGRCLSMCRCQVSILPLKASVYEPLPAPGRSEARRRLERGLAVVQVSPVGVGGGPEQTIAAALRCAKRRGAGGSTES